MIQTDGIPPNADKIVHDHEKRLQHLENRETVSSSLDVDFYGSPYASATSPIVFSGITEIDFSSGGFIVDGDGTYVSVDAATKPYYMPYNDTEVGFLPRPPLENSYGGITYVASGRIPTASTTWDGTTPGPGTGNQSLFMYASSNADQPIGSYFYAVRLTTGSVTVKGQGAGHPTFICKGSLTPVDSFTISDVGGLVKVQKITDSVWLASGDVAP